MSTPLLFTPLTLRGTTLRNRVVLSPMCQYHAVDGKVQDWHLAHHARFALGGLGAAIVEATAVAPEGRITPWCTGLWSDDHIAGWAQITKLYKTHGIVPGIQIGHSGRRGSCARPWEGAHPLALKGPGEPWQTVGASAIPEREGYPVPRELTAADIEDLVEAFRKAALRARTAGFDLIEVHGAHGYLLHSFFSPHSNKRTDVYGGSLENRMRLPLLVAETVRRVWPETLPVLYRVSSVDGVEGGLAIADTVALAKELARRGIDVIDCSSGGMTGSLSMSTAKIKPGFQVQYAEQIRREAGVKTMAVGAILDGRQAERILAESRADLIAIGRELLADPNWCLHAALALGHEQPYSVLPIGHGFFLERRAAVLDRS